MEINPYGAVAGIIVIVLLILIIASFACMVLLMILQAMGLIRFRKTSHFIAWSVAGGIVLALIFWQVKKSSRSSKVNTAPIESRK
jgi:hypothetical protein